MTTVEKITIAACIAIFALLAYGHISGAKEFNRVCGESGGTVVFDGRQKQCIKPEVRK